MQSRQVAFPACIEGLGASLERGLSGGGAYTKPPARLSAGDRPAPLGSRDRPPASKHQRGSRDSRHTTVCRSLKTTERPSGSTSEIKMVASPSPPLLTPDRNASTAIRRGKHALFILPHHLNTQIDVTAVTCALSSAVIPPVAVVTASGRQTLPCHVGAALMLIGADGESFVPVCSPKAATCHCSTWEED
ncbi:hypothetical protein JOQ06_022486, partial [Pogonophryne albipinna]